ncbi:MAG: methyl-accepting chemotaxis protein [Deltaproteobacteria bacterium]|nr:MAG: methyl-accepting chemotaxis protein [Deltaproteobacteria bacterium]
MARKKNRRSWKNYLINKNVQMKITGINLAYMLLAVLANTAIMLSSSICNIYYSDDTQFWKAIDFYILGSEVFTFSLVAVFILAVANQMWVTHKFCGPLVNFTHSFNKIAQGDLTRKVILRSKDLLKREASQFNDMMDDLSLHIEALKKDNRLLLSTLKDIIEDNGQPVKIEEARKIIQEQEDLFNAHISQIKLIADNLPANN